MIDLRSDTVTRPSEAMREAARDAEVGDDAYGEDPTVNELEARATALLGMDAALFVPSGTMGNQIAARTHTERGQEVIAERESHIVKWELGGLAQHAQLQTRLLDGDDRGVLDPHTVRNAVVGADSPRPGTGLLCLENTHNSKGGTAIAPERIDAPARAAHDADLPVHLDGARLFNAAIARDVPACRFTEHVDSVLVCLSKGLGAPVGSVLAGSESFIERARRTRKLMGGGMRQAGIVAAPGLKALDNRDRLAEDHVNAQRLADGLADVPGIDPDDPETNIVVADTAEPADGVAAACEEAGVACLQFGDHRIRCCTHKDVDRAAVQTAVDRMAGALG